MGFSNYLARSNRWFAVGTVLTLLAINNSVSLAITPLDQSKNKNESLHSLQTILNSDGFSPQCQEALPGWNIKDPEFNQDEMLAVWRTSPKLGRNENIKTNGLIYISPIDDSTGNFSLVGQAQIDDSNPVPQKSVVNGPEWANSQRGWEIYYSCFSADFKTVRLCKLTREQSAWRAYALPLSDGKGMRQPTKNPTDLVPIVLFQNYEGTIAKGLRLEKGLFGWRQDIEIPNDIMLSPDIGEGKWTPDGNDFIHIKDTEHNNKRITQLAIYNRLTGEDKFIFFDGRERWDPFAWSAPELGGQTAIVAIVQNQQKGSWDVEAYRQNERGEWVVWSVIEPLHENFRVNYSPEAFVIAGKSYASIVSYYGGNRQGWRTNPSIVWIATVDPDLPETEQVRRIVSKEIDGNQRPSQISHKTDPESLLINEEKNARIYYVDFGKNGSKPKLMNCDTGLVAQ